MIKYLVVESTVKLDKIMSNTYGICACNVDDGLIDVINCVYDISHDAEWVKALAKKLNQYDVDPIHLNDIIEDELYNLRGQIQRAVYEKKIVL